MYLRNVSVSSGKGDNSVFFHSSKCLYLVSFPTTVTKFSMNSHWDMNMIMFLTAGLCYSCIFKSFYVFLLD